MSFPKMTPFRVFRYSNDFPENFTEIFNKGIIVDVNDPAYVGMEHFGGWCNPDDPTDKSTSVNYLGEKFEVGYVRYTRSVPAKALKFAVDEKVKKERKQNGHISRERKREIKEMYKNAMLQEAPVQPSVTRVEVNPVRMEIIVFSSSNPVLEDIENRIAEDFGVKVFGETFVDLIPGDDMVEIEGVGEKFLTWLWYVSETDSFNTFEGRKTPVNKYTISPDSRVVVGNADTGKCSVSGDIREAKNGVFNGKGVTQFSFVLYPSGGVSIPCVMNSGGFIDKVSFRGLPLSRGNDEGDVEADALMCLEAIDEARDFTKSAFHDFWNIYSDEKKWKQVQDEIGTWARGDVCIRSFEGI